MKQAEVMLLARAYVRQENGHYTATSPEIGEAIKAIGSSPEEATLRLRKKIKERLA